MIHGGYYNRNIDTDYILLLLAYIKQNIVWMCHRYAVCENLMLSNNGAMILILQLKYRSYQLNIRIKIYKAINDKITSIIRETRTMVPWKFVADHIRFS